MCKKCVQPAHLSDLDVSRFTGMWFPLMSTDSASLIDNAVLNVDSPSPNTIRAKTFIKRKLLDETVHRKDSSSNVFKSSFGFADFAVIATDYDRYAIVLSQFCCLCGLVQYSTITIYGRDPSVADDKMFMMDLFEVIERECAPIHRTLLRPAYHTEVIQK